MWLWINITPATGEQKTTAHLEVFKTTASVAVMLGGIGALYLAARRQRTQEAEHAHAVRVAEINRLHAERVAAATEDDAVRRRVTELYTKAADQLAPTKHRYDWPGCTRWNVLVRTTPTNEPPSRSCGAPTCACPTPHLR